MDLDAELAILDICFKFAYGNSRSRHDGNEGIARVVYFDKLNEHLFERDEDLFWEMRNEHGDLLQFLNNQGRFIIRTYLKRDWNLWSYEIMSIDKYNNDKRHYHNYFNTLYEAKHAIRTSLVFVTYLKQDKMAFEAERAQVKKQTAFVRQRELLNEKKQIDADEIMMKYENSKLNDKSIRHRESVRNRLRSLLTNLFPDVPLFVDIMGSTVTGLATLESDLNICIRVSAPYLRSHVQANNFRMVDLRNSARKVFNMRYIAMELRKQTRFRYIKPHINSHQPFIDFLDENSTIPCNLAFDYGLGIETSNLIGEYVRLDKRVGPFIYCIKKFALCQGIDDSDGFLGSYAYTLMALYYLISVLRNPILPCLQDFRGHCYARDCRSRSNNMHLIFQKTGSMDENVNSSFHTCIEIENNQTDRYTPQRNRVIFSVWESNNGLNLLTLLEEFFRYFSHAENFKNISIIQEGGQLVKTRNNNIWSADSVVIQDPFLIKKNIGKKCLDTSVEDITDKFNRAANMLQEGVNFSDICFL